MNKSILLALAPLALLANPAAAQTTVHERTVVTPHGDATRTVTRTNDAYGNRTTVERTNRVTPNGTVSRTVRRGDDGLRERTVVRTNEHGWNGTRSWSRNGHGMRHCWTTWRH